MNEDRISPKGKRALAMTARAGLLVVVFAATQWQLYDATHGRPERFAYYLLTCAYLAGVLTSAVFRLGNRWPMDSRTWKRALVIHVTASLVLTSVGILVEATIGWLPRSAGWPYRSALWHYFAHHTQISILTYWALLGALHIYRMHDRARQRELHTAQIETQLREAQLTALRTQLQPHFLFNTLQAATMSIYEDPAGAEEILLSLSELLRLSLKSFDQQEIPLRSEIEFLKHYARIQERRFADRLRFEFQIEAQCEVCAVPALLLQPLLENAVRHGVGVRKEADVIWVRAYRDRNRLSIVIENNVGALNGSFEMLAVRGVGLANTVARLERLYVHEQSFQISNLSPRGVAVSLSIPALAAGRPKEQLEFQAAS